MGGTRRAVAALAAATLIPACFGGATEVSESGKGLPVVSIGFPPSAPPASVHRAALRVENPGPGDIARLVVAFALVGAPAAEGLPHPLVDPGRSAESGSVVGVAPAPTSVSDDGVVYRFGALGEGESVVIRFRVRVPRAPGLAASSVTVYDDVEPGRARGVRLETTVRR